MITREAFLTEMEHLEPGYVPDMSVHDQTRRIHLLPVMGPSAVGKNTSLEVSGLFKVISETSREMRTGETGGDPYHFIDSPDKWQQTLEAANQGMLVQFKIHPTTHEYYGSHSRRYPSYGPAAIDVIPKQYYDFLKMGVFGKVTGIYIVAEDFDSWLKRFFASRGDLPEEQVAARMQEAESSLETGLSDPGIRFILNDAPERAALDLRKLSEGQDIDSRRELLARKCGDLMLRGLLKIDSRY